ncbi:MAG TPA: beta-L-arabinofuranosidase domain-containing protein [Longimicrobiales bacterium]|nr:beta-L-arabinofuranosidase domain-containing protein [Longimicrobiales bacterium]
MPDEPQRPGVSRRELLSTMGKAAVWTVVVPPFLTPREALAGPVAGAAPSPSSGGAPLVALAGPDRVVVTPAGAAGRTYLNAWAGYGEPPWRRRRRRGEPATPPVETGPAPAVRWSRKSGAGEVVFADSTSPVTTASFTVPGEYVLELVADNGESRVASTFRVSVEPPPPEGAPEPVATRGYRIGGRLWDQRAKALIVTWIPHCIAQLERSDLELGAGGIDNFVEAAKALRGEAHGGHKGYVFSNAYVHNTIESMCMALMVDPRGDAEIEAAQAKMRATLEDWIPKVLAAREPDGYLQTAYTLRDPARWRERWTPQGRGNHEGYVGGYFIEAAIAHHVMTKGRDTRLYDAARKLADCWDAHIGPAPKQEWFDGHQEMEQALVRLGRYVDGVEGSGKGERYVRLARFLLDCRRAGSEYDQSHLPVVQQYEAVGHAVRAAYTYSAMADVALETRDPEYLSAVRSIWDSIVDKKYYVTGGIGSGETSEGFGPEYSLRNNAYCESCSSCGEIFFQAKMNRLYKDARHADLMEDTLYNALLGSLDREGRHYYYDNPLDTNIARYAWHNVPCCVGNIPRTLLSLPTWMYAKGADGLYVNLFVPSTVTVEDVAGTDVELVQETNYPWEGKVRIRVSPASARTFAVRVRAPDRMVSGLYRATPAANGIARIAVNGKVVRAPVERGYAVITRTWKPGDTIDLLLPMRVQRVYADPRIEADRGRVALKYGPLLYNIEREDQEIDQALDPHAPLTTEWRGDLLGGVTVIRGRFANGAPLLAIPNFVRGNRLAGTDAPRRPPRPADGSRPMPFPATSIVWMREA